MDTDFLPAMQAIRAGDLKALGRLLAADPTLATRRSTSSHPTLLQHIAVDGGLGLVPDPGLAAQVLVDAGAALEAPFVAAASTACIDVVDVLLAAGVAIDAQAPWTAVEEATYWGHRDMVAHLLSRGATVSSLLVAAGRGSHELLECFLLPDGSLRLDAGPVRSPFMDAVDPDEAVQDQHILDQAFVIALINEQTGAADWLLEHGADINGRPTGTHWRGAALHAMVDFERPSLITWLRERGADLSVRGREFHETPLERANHQGRHGGAGGVLEALQA